MSGVHNGLQAKIKERHTKNAHYMHCNAHNLNLVIVDISKSCTFVEEFFNTMQAVYVMCSASTKRFARLEELVNARVTNNKGEGSGSNQSTTVGKLSNTRWNCRYENVKRVKEKFKELLTLIREIIEENGSKSPEAKGLYDRLNSFQFVFTMLLMENLLGKTNVLSKFLQKGDQNLLSAIIELQELQKSFNQHQTDDEVFNKYYVDAKEFALNHGVPLPSPAELEGTGRLLSASKKWKANDAVLIAGHLFSDRVEGLSVPEVFSIGDKVEAKFRTAEGDVSPSFFPGTVASVEAYADSSAVYTISFNDGDVSENVPHAEVRLPKQSQYYAGTIVSKADEGNFYDVKTVIMDTEITLSGVKVKDLKRVKPRTVREAVRADIFDPVVAITKSEFEKRFNESVIERYNFILNLTPSRIDSISVENIKSIYAMYDGDFTENEQDLFNEHELESFKRQAMSDSFYYDVKKMSDRTIQDVLVAMIQKNVVDVFPVIFKSYFLLLLLPVSTASSERSFSAMKLVKTRLRTKISDEWLFNLMLLYINRDISKDIQPEEILYHWYHHDSTPKESRKHAKKLAASAIGERGRTTRMDIALERRKTRSKSV
jgi:hypothetical protein